MVENAENSAEDRQKNRRTQTVANLEQFLSFTLRKTGWNSIPGAFRAMFHLSTHESLKRFKEINDECGIDYQLFKGEANADCQSNKLTFSLSSRTGIVLNLDNIELTGGFSFDFYHRRTSCKARFLPGRLHCSVVGSIEEQVNKQLPVPASDASVGPRYHLICLTLFPRKGYLREIKSFISYPIADTNYSNSDDKQLIEVIGIDEMRYFGFDDIQFTIDLSFWLMFRELYPQDINTDIKKHSRNEDRVYPQRANTVDPTHSCNEDRVYPQHTNTVYQTHSCNEDRVYPQRTNTVYQTHSCNEDRVYPQHTNTVYQTHSCNEDRVYPQRTNTVDQTHSCNEDRVYPQRTNTVDQTHSYNEDHMYPQCTTNTDDQTHNHNEDYVSWNMSEDRCPQHTTEDNKTYSCNKDHTFCNIFKDLYPHDTGSHYSVHVHCTQESAATVSERTKSPSDACLHRTLNLHCTKLSGTENELVESVEASHCYKPAILHCTTCCEPVCNRHIVVVINCTNDKGKKLIGDDIICHGQGNDKGKKLIGYDIICHGQGNDKGKKLIGDDIICHGQGNDKDKKLIGDVDGIINCNGKGNGNKECDMHAASQILENGDNLEVKGCSVPEGSLNLETYGNLEEYLDSKLPLSYEELDFKELRQKEERSSRVLDFFRARSASMRTSTDRLRRGERCNENSTDKLDTLRTCQKSGVLKRIKSLFCCGRPHT